MALQGELWAAARRETGPLMNVARLHRWSKSALIVLIALIEISLSHICAQERDERVVRAAYTFNLVKFVDWPPSQGDLWIGFIGSSANGDVLRDLLDGRKSDSHTLHVVLSPRDEVLEKCNIVYFGDVAPEQIQKTLDKLGGLAALTLGETDSFPRHGGMIGLVKAGDHIQIVVNLQLTQRAGIKVSSRVLSLATIVRSDGGS